MTSRLRLLGLFFAIGFGAALLHVSGPSGCSATCGNGVVDEGEVCDDGNKDDGDGCSAACETETAGGGTTGGTTTGGTTTGGGTTGGSDGDTCTTAADCDDAFSSAPICRSPENCQGDRQIAACNHGVCTSLTVEDDSACTETSFTRDCGLGNSGGSCDGTVSQTVPNCEFEICNDGPIPPNVNSDDDGDGLVNCADTVDCPQNTQCTTNSGSLALCLGGNCSD